VPALGHLRGSVTRTFGAGRPGSGAGDLRVGPVGWAARAALPAWKSARCR